MFYPVSTYKLALDHYGRDNFNTDYRNDPDGKAFMRGVPYKPGNVLWVTFDGETAQRAIVARFWRDTAPAGVGMIEKYRVHVENRQGDAFCRNWRYAWPCQIGDGYALASAAAANKKRCLAA